MTTTRKTTRRAFLLRWGCALTAAVAVLWKAFWLWQGAFPFNSDEAVVALMARHILAGERPTFFYGQAYMGSLDAFLVAGGFALFGTKVWVVRLVQTILYAGTVMLTCALARRLFDAPEAGWAAGLLMAIPTVNMTLYTTVSLGGYGEAMLLGTALLLLAVHPWGERPWGALAWGLLAGLGAWVLGLTLVYAAPAGLYLLWRWRRLPWRQRLGRLGLVVLGGLLGAWPWWWYGFRHGWAALLKELTGSAVAVPSGGFPQRLLTLTVLGLPVIMGVRPPWDVGLLAAPLAVGVLVAFLALLLAAWHVRRQWRPAWWLPVGVIAVVFAGFLLTPFGNDPSGRYFLPVTQMVFVGFGGLAAHFRWRKYPLGWWLVAFLVLYFGVSTAQAAANPYRLTTQFAPDARVHPGDEARLIAFLESHGETRGYTTYWVAYPLAFLSDETLIFVPRLPYHRDFRYTPRDDRYPPYDAMVAASPRVAYITVTHPPLDACLREGFQRAGITWKEAVIGDYRVFYDLSRPIAPEQALAACEQ
ncbi:MAG: hypothetical protein GXO56_08020 [Chloroflexi bacterium]|nr:hypothetical protein [Chloroflexota bacterium]